MAGVHYNLKCCVEGCKAEVNAWDSETIGIGNKSHNKGWRALMRDGQTWPDNYCPRHSNTFMGPVFGVSNRTKVLERTLARANNVSKIMMDIAAKTGGEKIDMFTNIKNKSEIIENLKAARKEDALTISKLEEMLETSDRENTRLLDRNIEISEGYVKLKEESEKADTRRVTKKDKINYDLQVELEAEKLKVKILEGELDMALAKLSKLDWKSPEITI